ncbi:MAG: hypothetical protein HZA61_12330 [Candidatus Eisenbacteria bacterium]|uniref:Glycerophosphoryl diester phosphodiesterase membrane domain-containing protein n=1 Tax=Eiseniibacteriota bacterium TaxID=2212470 RepID=A0A933SEI0_UNCEI|nr:hypothetical protein [Candidatus Eisenbacteria bacterium]
MSALGLGSGPPTVRNLFADYFRAFLRAPGISIGLPLLLGVPGFLSVVFVAVAISHPSWRLSTESRSMAVVIGAYLVFGALYVLLIGTSALTLVAAARGENLSIAQGLREGARRFLSLFAVVLLYALTVLVGLVLLIVPGVIAAIRFSVAVPACVVEGIGPLAAMRRRSELTKDHDGTIFGARLLLGLLLLPANLVFRAGTEKLPLAVSFLVLLVYFGQILVEMLVPAVTYFRLRSAREGFGTEDVMETFR